MKAARQHSTESSKTVSTAAPARPLVPHKEESTFLSPAQPRPFIQTRLNIGKVDDKYEREADNSAYHFSKNISVGQDTGGSVRRKMDPSGITPISDQEKKRIQQKNVSGEVRMPSAEFEDKLNASQGSGELLPDGLRDLMQEGFGRDLSRVKVHNDTFADDLNDEMNSQAFAYNNHIYFRRGHYNPDNIIGIQLLAHELTHVIQQGKTEPLIETPPDPVVAVASNAPKPPITPVRPVPPPPRKRGAGRKHKAKDGLKEGPAKAGKAAGTDAEKGKPKGSPKSPEEDPAFMAVVGKVKKQAKKTQKHDPAEKKTVQAQAAVKLPENEVQSQAKSKQVNKMGDQKPQKFNAEAFKQALMGQIEKVAPKNLEEANDFKENNRIEEVKGAVSGKVDQEKTNASQDIQETTTEAPGTEGITARPAQPLPPSGVGQATTNVGANKATPPARTAEEVSLKEGSDSLDREMREGDLTEQQVKDSNEPSFNQALDAKKDAQKDAIAAPQQYRADEKLLLKKAQGEAQKDAAHDLLSMHHGRAGGFGKVELQQNKAKLEEEKTRQQIALDLERIYGEAKTKVETRLLALTTTTATMFDTGAQQARADFEAYVDRRMSAYKSDRYSGWFGGLKWAKDKLFGMPNAVNVFYTEGRDKYLRQMDTVINRIAEHVASELNTATQEIADGRKAVQDYFNSLDADKQRIGQETLNEVMGRFDALETSVEDKQGELVDTLAQKYKENLEQVDARIEEMKAANEGLVDKAINFVKGVINTLRELKDLLFNVLSKVAQIIGYIIRHPIAFLENLIDGIAQGLKNFGKNILKHLQDGFIKWFTGSSSIKNIRMPESLNAKGILMLVMDVIGLTVENFMERALKKIPPEMLEKLKTGFEIFQIIMKEGLIGLWHYLQDKLENIIVSTKEQVFSYLENQVLQAGLDFVMKLLTPAGAFIKACQMIYKIVKFIWENAKRILEFINGVLDSMIDVAAGKVDAAAKKVEQSLANVIPLAIGFLASLVGLDGVPKKVEEILKRVRGVIENAFDWVIDKAWEFGKKAFGFVLKKGKQALKALVNWWKISRKFKTGDGEEHKLYFESEGDLEPTVASDPQKVQRFLKLKETEYANKKATDPKKIALGKATTKNDELKVVLKALKAAEASTKNEAQSMSTTDNQTLYKAVTDKVDELTPLLIPLLNKGQYPPVVLPTFTNNVLGSSFKAQFITKKNIKRYPDTNVNQHKGHLEGWEFVQRAGLTGSGENWVRMHLLTARINGEPTDSNLTPARHVLNINSLLPVEVAADQAVQKDGETIWYKVGVSYQKVPIPAAIQGNSTRTEAQYLSSIKVNWGTYKNDDPKTEIDGTPSVDETVNPPVFSGVVLQNIHDVGEPFLARNINDMSPSGARFLAQSLRTMKAKNIRATDMNDLANKLLNLKENALDITNIRSGLDEAVGKLITF